MVKKRPGEKWSVLVVDDDPEMVNVIVAFLKTSGNFSYIITAADGAEAVNKYNNQEFDLVIMDCMLPRKTGFESIGSMKQSGKFKKAKFILISGAVRSEDVVKAAMIGVKSFLVKPFSRQKLLETVYKLLLPEKK